MTINKYFFSLQISKIRFNKYSKYNIKKKIQKKEFSTYNERY